MNNINIHSETRNGVTTFQGYVDRQQVIVISNNINGLYFTVGSSSCLPSDFVKAKAYSECIARTFEAVEKHTSFQKEDRVIVKSGCFSAGACGTIVFVEPNADGKVWVQRDRASEPCFYYRHELDKVK